MYVSVIEMYIEPTNRRKLNAGIAFVGFCTLFNTVFVALVFNFENRETLAMFNSAIYMGCYFMYALCCVGCVVLSSLTINRLMFLNIHFYLQCLAFAVMTFTSYSLVYITINIPTQYTAGVDVSMIYYAIAISIGEALGSFIFAILSAYEHKKLTSNIIANPFAIPQQPYMSLP